MSEWINKEELYSIVTGSIWYYNRLGAVGEIPFPTVDNFYVKCRIYKKQFCFRWEDIHRKFFPSKEEAEREAKRYLDDVLPYVSLDTLKKIINLKEDSEFYYIEKGYDRIDCDHLEKWSHWNKYKRAFIVMVEYDDDYGGGLDEWEYPISEYGKTWALTKEELEHNETI